MCAYRLSLKIAAYGPVSICSRDAAIGKSTTVRSESIIEVCCQVGIPHEESLCYKAEGVLRLSLETRRFIYTGARVALIIVPTQPTHPSDALALARDMKYRKRRRSTR